MMQRWFHWLFRLNVPRGVGIGATALVILASIGYGTVAGGHVADVMAGFYEARDAAANAAGFRITEVSVAGERHVSGEEILAIAGITATTSLPFFNVETARERLKANPWIADASLLKLYPGALQISVKERNAFALWQKDRKVSVIADDGTVLEPFANPRLIRLPRVVGRGAEVKAKDFLALLDRYPAVSDLVLASILVGERRWNLRLKNGLDVRLPESDVGAALERLVALDRDKKLLSRDIVAVDLRLADRVIVRQSDALAAARADALKKEKAAKKGGNA